MNQTTHDLSGLLSIDSSPLARLSAEQRERLTELMERYLSALEDGPPLEQASLLAAHPDLANTLRVYFRCLEDLHGAAAGFDSTTRRESRRQHEAVDDAKRIGDFVLVREIGRGGMGVVYEARQISLDRRVAVKLLPFAAVLDSKQIARFKNEAQAAAQVQHPNIVPVFAIGVERGVHYYAMQFIDGQPLDRAIAELQARTRRTPHSGVAGVESASLQHSPGNLSQYTGRSWTRPQPPIEKAERETQVECHAPTDGSFLAIASKTRSEYFNTVAHLGIQAAEALHAAHEYGVVHRDVKPSNLILDAAGKLWVTDFGLARCQKDSPQTLTKTGDVVGTMRYMSPEQAAGQSALVDQRTDVYSLGVTLYELLCLRPAFPEADGAALLRQIDQHEPPRPRHIRPDIPADLETVILKAMAKNRDERYTTSRQLADDLRCVIEGKPTLARPPSVANRFAKWTWRHRRIAALAAAALVVASVGLAGGTLLISREKARAEQNFVRAERYFRDSRNVLDSFGVKLSERLADVPGAAHVRQELLEETLQYYHDFMADAKDDPNLRSDMALTYSKVARLTDEVGSADEAIAAHENALRLFEQLVRADAESPDHQKQLALCENNLALALSRAGRVEDAGKHLANALRIQQRLNQNSPGDEKLLADLALSFSNQGLLQSETGQTALAQESFRLATELFQQLVNLQPRDSERRHKLAAAYNNLAATRLDDHPADAASLHSQALDHELAAAEARPDDLTYRRHVALTLNNLGAAYSRAGQHTEALRRHENAIALQSELVRLDPAQRSYQGDLAVSHNNVGLIHQRGGRAADAEASFRKALAIQKPLAEHYGDDIGVLSSLGGICNNLGIVLEESGRFDEAAEAFELAIEHQRGAYSRAADVTRFGSFLSKHYVNYARVLERLGRDNESARAATARRELSKDNVERSRIVIEE